MERIVNLHIEKLSEGGFLATSEDLQGLIAQGRTIEGAIEIARDVARNLMEAQTIETSAIALVTASDYVELTG